MNTRTTLRIFMLLVLSFGTYSCKSRTQKETILVVFAHPDDETTIGPVLAKYAEEHAVYLVFSTDGRFGVNDHSGIPAGDTLVEIRKKEAACSCAALGINEPIFLGIQDGMGLNCHGNFYEQEGLLKKRLLQTILDIQPTKIITFGPGGDTGHPDHRLLGAITTELLLRENLIDQVDLYYFSWTKEQAEKYAMWDLNYADKSLLDVEISFEQRHKESLISSIRCHKSQYSQEQMENWIALERADDSNVLYFRKFKRDKQKKSAF